MSRIATEVQAVEVLPSGEEAFTSSHGAAATFRDYCWPPLHSDRRESEEPPNKRRRVVTDGLQLPDEAAGTGLDSVCLCQIKFESVSVYSFCSPTHS